MGKVEGINTISEDNAQTAHNEENSGETLSDPCKKLVSLIVRIVVNATLRECYEEGDKISEI
ncbi:MAG TPA: hypothetical protein VHA52_01605 [Candidatus Babeliaceae bacterium]|nr:hypothetical protein [Candidatus Babeliaceae bacterium]